jgi:hypothetical protein
MPYMLLHHLLKLGEDHGPCFVAAFTQCGIDGDFEGKVLEAIGTDL